MNKLVEAWKLLWPSLNTSLVSAKCNHDSKCDSIWVSLKTKQSKWNKQIKIISQTIRDTTFWYRNANNNEHSDNFTRQRPAISRHFGQNIIEPLTGETMCGWKIWKLKRQS